MAITPTRLILPPLTPLTSSPIQKEQSTTPQVDFGTVLKNAMGDVNKTLLESETMDSLLAQGKLNNVHDAVIAAEKASMALELTVQVRNRIVEAYQEIMRMNI
ncbi:MAG TPA: flagellar hook-basal body complex protein FliE [Bacillota bacterium]|nr:flagellar hook-basal body complex protein FliE [Bacillota bacterium]